MKKKNNSHIESLKKDMNGAAVHSRRVMAQAIEQTTAKVNEIREAGHKSFDSINGLMHENGMKPHMFSPVKDTYRKNLELAQKVIRQITESQKESIELSAGFADSLLEILGREDFTGAGAPEQLFALVEEHLKNATDHSANSMMKLLESYYDFLQYSMKFNRNFANVLLTEMSNLVKIQHKNTGIFLSGNMLADWWNK